MAAEGRRRASERLRRVLGEARGGALKAGQLLATVSALFPADPDATWDAALADLPADNPPVPLAELVPVLSAELGPAWRDGVGDLDPTAVAAASIGQVHRARWPDGRDVAVKVQYDGIAEALRDDLALVSAMTRLGAVVAPGMALPPLVAEMRERLSEELDQRREARVQTAMREAFAGEVEIPAVVEATRRVLVAEWLDGVPFTRLPEVADQATRDAAGAAYMTFLLSGPERAGWLHTDPHPGNFFWLGDGPDGRLGVVDFGSALPLPDGMPRTFGRLIALLRADDPAETLAGLRAEGFVRPGASVEAVKLRGYLAPFTEPSAQEMFSFTPEWLRGTFGQLGDPRNPDFAVALQLTMPPEHLFTHRVWLGIVGVLCRLRATVPVRPVVERWLPGIDG